MSPLDSRAAEALAALEADRHKPTDGALASDWSRFILSLMYRTPERIDFIRRKMRSSDNDPRLDRAYQALMRDGAPTNLAEYKQSAGDALYDELQARLVRKLIDSPMIGGHLNNMLWSISSLPSPKNGLLLSDSPVMTSNGLGKPDSFVALAISPTRFFLAVNTREMATAFVSQRSDALERAFNDAAVQQAGKLVIGNTDRHLRFVENRLGRTGAERTAGYMERMAWCIPSG